MGVWGWKGVNELMTPTAPPYNDGAVYKRPMRTESIRDEHEHRKPGAARRDVTRVRAPVEPEPEYGLHEAVADLDEENQRLRMQVDEQARQIRWLRLVARMD